MAELQRRKGSETRNQILSFAETAVLEKGFAGTSIDELITAQAQKLDTLKTHKKGLMQLLFPSTDEVDG